MCVCYNDGRLQLNDFSKQRRPSFQRRLNLFLLNPFHRAFGEQNQRRLIIATISYYKTEIKL